MIYNEESLKNNRNNIHEPRSESILGKNCSVNGSQLDRGKKE